MNTGCWCGTGRGPARERTRRGKTWTDFGRPSGGIQAGVRADAGSCVQGRGLRVGTLPAFSCDGPRTTMRPPQGQRNAAFVSADKGSSVLAVPTSALVTCPSVFTVASPGLPALALLILQGVWLHGAAVACCGLGLYAPCPTPFPPLLRPPVSVPPAGLPSLPLKDWFPPVLPRRPARPSLCRPPRELICW